jgi:integrase
LKGQADAAGETCDSAFADLIFTTARDEPINEEYLVKKHFKPLLRDWSAEYPSSTIRHTAATLALTVGVSPKVVSEQLGHTSAAFTLDVFACPAAHAG